jgi:glycosyltransferase involved in cell wall biosynthesis
LSAGRLGIYIDAPFRVVEGVAAVHPADFALVGVFLAEVGRHFDSLVLFGRAERSDDLDVFVPLPGNVELVELPHYGGLLELHRVLGASFGTARRFWRGLDDLDTVWLFGPHPFALLLIALALLRRKQSVLGVRQDTMAYFRSRLPSRWWAPALLPAFLLDWTFRLLARRLKTLVAGAEIARRYGGERERLLVMADSVVRRRELASGPRRRNESGPIRLLTVGRLDPEKNPLLLVEGLAKLDREEPGRYRLLWIGGGPLEERVRARAAERGVLHALELAGWLPFGPKLLDLYRRADAFVHVSFTEGVPRVLFEALACAAPIVATDVGGVRAALDDGAAGVLVPVDDVDALVAAVRLVVDDRALRDRLVRRGLELARERTLEQQAARVAAFISGSGEIDEAREAA